MAVVYCLFARSLGLPVWDPLVSPFWETHAPGWAGVVLCAAAVFGIAASLVSFGSSFRIGIDEKTPGGLVTEGVFALSRNPVYLSFFIFFMGIFLIHKNAAVSIWIVFYAFIAHRQVLREERFLRGQYGDEYAKYCRRVRRYF